MDIDKLKALALAATPGPWIHDAEDNIIYPANGGLMIDICCRSTDLGTEQRDNNAAFVAGCHPATVLELIAEVEKLRKQLAERDSALRAEPAGQHDAESLEAFVDWFMRYGTREHIIGRLDKSRKNPT